MTVYGIITVFLIYILMFMIQQLVEVKVSDIKQGKSNYMQLVIGDDEGAGQSFVVLGSTTNYLMVYDPARDLAKVVTIENVTSLAPKPNLKK